jgi:Fe-S cluster biogenesis protein NfuA
MADQEQIQKIIEDDIRPALQGHGGDIELVSVEGDDVTVRLKGACAGCPGARMTLKNGVEKHLQEVVSSDITVEAVAFDQE